MIPLFIHKLDKLLNSANESDMLTIQHVDSLLKGCDSVSKIVYGVKADLLAKTVNKKIIVGHESIQK